MSKCEMFVFGGTKVDQQRDRAIARASFPALNFPSSSELTLLGASNLPEAVPATMKEKTVQAELLTSRLGKLDAHQALFLLKNCLSLPKLLYVLRCSQAWKFPHLLQVFDNVIRTSVSRITNTDMTDTVWKPASLLVAKGGLGLRCAEQIAFPAYMASIFSATHLVSSMVADFDIDDLLGTELTT